MTSMRGMRGTLVLAATALVAYMATAQVLFLQPKPGDIYREYARVVTGDDVLVTDPDTPNPQAQTYLPNARIPFSTDDLQDARDSVDIVITLWGGHEGTTGK